MPYQCDSGDDNPVVMILTNQLEAETSALCGECFPQWVHAIHVAIFGEPEPPVAPAKRTRKAKASTSAPDAASGDPGPASDPETGDDTDDDAARDASADYDTSEPDQQLPLDDVQAS